MATTFSGSFVATVVGSYSKGDDFVGLPGPINDILSHSFTNGTGANQVSAPFAKRVTLAPAASVTYDLNALTDVYGDALNFTKLRVLYVRNRETVSNRAVSLSGDFKSSFVAGTGVILTINAGGVFIITSPISGLTVAGPGQDEITITSDMEIGGANVTVDILVLGNV
jgi:hypothetical protein